MSDPVQELDSCSKEAAAVDKSSEGRQRTFTEKGYSYQKQQKSELRCRLLKMLNKKMQEVGDLWSKGVNLSVMEKVKDELLVLDLQLMNAHDSYQQFSDCGERK